MEYQKALFEAISDGVMVLDETGQVIEVNGAVCRMYGYTKEELSRLPLEVGTAGTPPYDMAHALALLQKARAEGPQILEWLARHKSGALFWVEVHACFVQIAGEGRFIVTVRDITDRIEAGQELRESERRLSTLFGNLPGMVYRCLNERDWPLDFASEGCRNLTGYGPEELTRKDGLTYGALILPEDRDMVWDAVQAGVALDTHFEVSYRILHRDGGVRWVWDRGVAVMENGEPSAVEGFITDITAHRRAEEAQARLEKQIQQTQKLESLGMLAGGIAHDFNNILMAVLGHAELAMEELSSVSPVREHLCEIEGAARRAADLCRQMLAYSGKATFSQTPLSLPEVVHEMAHLLKNAISGKAVLNLRIERGLPNIFADPGQIRQILLNLVTNASEAIGERSGVITVSAGATRCDMEYLRKTELCDQLPEGLYVHLEVADTGCGMDPETRRRLFEPFFSTKFTGRGLGLAAVLGIVRAHRGALVVYTEPGKGSSFKVLFPALEQAGKDGGTDRGGRGKGLWRGRGTVLLVDDEESLRALGAKMLGQMGLTVLTAPDGCEAVKCYRESGGDIDLVMLDLTMPRMDGAETFGELRRINPEVRVVMASGYSKDDVLARFPGRGLAGVVQKPYTLSVLRDTLSKLLPAAGD